MIGLATLTAIALLAFASNSVLCRIALRETAIDPASFTTIRVMSGAAALLVVAKWSRWSTASAFAKASAGRARSRSWTAAGLLALYAVPFAFAYTQLTAGTGALILFGSVQLTMLAVAFWLGERPHPAQWLGLSIALVGLGVLVSPGLAAPPVAGAGLMAIAGIAWGGYSWWGRGATNPLGETAINFLRAVPLVLAVSIVWIPRARLDVRGTMLAIVSGAVASGLGYVAWYGAVRRLTGMQAAVVQLSVPVLAAAGGVIFLSETISIRLVVATVLVLGGIALAVTRRGA